MLVRPTGHLRPAGAPEGLSERRPGTHLGVAGQTVASEVSANNGPASDAQPPAAAALDRRRRVGRAVRDRLDQGTGLRGSLRRLERRVGWWPRLAAGALVGARLRAVYRQRQPAARSASPACCTRSCRSGSTSRSAGRAARPRLHRVRRLRRLRVRDLLLDGARDAAVRGAATWRRSSRSRSSSSPAGLVGAADRPDRAAAGGRLPRDRHAVRRPGVRRASSTTSTPARSAASTGIFAPRSAARLRRHGHDPARLLLRRADHVRRRRRRSYTCSTPREPGRAWRALQRRPARGRGR